MSPEIIAADRCEAVLVCTSALRNALVRLRDNDADPALREAMLLASQALRSVFTEEPLEALAAYGEALHRLTRLWESHGGSLDGCGAAVGIIERSVDGLAAGVPMEHLRPLYDALRQTFPPPWQGCLETDDATFTTRLQAPSGGTASAESVEQALQRELRATFVAEADEGFAVCEELLIHLEQRPDDRAVLDALFRQLHTLKGAAAAVDLPEAAAQLHSGESLLQAVRDGTAVLDGVTLVDFLLRLADSVRGLIDRGCGRDDSPYAVIGDVERDIAALIGATAPSALPEALVGGRTGGDARLGAAPDGAPHRDPVVLGSQLHALAELRDRLGRGEGAGDIRQFIDALDQQARQFWDLASELKEQVNSLVLIPLEQLFRRLQRPARDAARKEGKLVTLELSGGTLRVDRAVAERLHAPLLHLVRNAVSHGIEVPEVRERVGKHRTGIVRVLAAEQAHELSLVVEDDGGGLDLAAIRAKAAARGWIEAHDTPTREVLARLILRSGFSTRDDVTDLAGRGVGMDVVAREVEALHGAIDIDSQDGKGTRIRLVIPIEKGSTSEVRPGPSAASGTVASRSTA